MISAGRAVIIAFRRDVDLYLSAFRANYFDGLLALLRSLSATAIPGARVEPPVIVRLEPLWLTQRMFLEQAASVRELTSVFGRHLTRLAVRAGFRVDDGLREPETRAEARTAVARLLENRALPALRELVIDWRSSLSVPLDLAGVHAPPPGLTFLSVWFDHDMDVLLSPAIRAGLASLAIQCPAESIDPPRCLCGAGGSFGRLTRLVYGLPYAFSGLINLAPWGRSEFSVPTLVEMEAIACGFTLNEVGLWGRGSWCKGFLASLPRLERLVLRAVSQTRRFRASANGWMGAATVETMITTRLPRAARESGRRLDVAVHQAVGTYAARRARFGWRTLSNMVEGFEMAFEAPPYG
jgi:hypothetical protein